MPVAVSYPGVYVNEEPSGARAIAGVGTSITAFLGMAGRGPMFSPEFGGSFADFERTYGSETDGELADQVFQFFVNGGTQAYVVRIANNAISADVVLRTEEATPRDALRLTARDAGLEGNLIRAEVDYDTANPERSFNMTLFRSRLQDDGTFSREDEESFSGLSMDPNSAFFVGSVSEVYAWAADCCGEAGPRRCPPDHADEMEPSQIAVQVLRGDAAIAAQETLQLAVAAIDRLNVEGIPDPLSGRKVQGFVANAHGRSAGRIAAMTVRNQNDVGIQNRFEHRLQGLGVDRRKNLADGCAAAIGGDQDRHLFIRQAALAGLAATLARLAIQSARSLVALKHVSLVNFDNALEFRPILACGLQETVPPAEGRIDAKSASTGRFPYRLALGQRHAE